MTQTTPENRGRLDTRTFPGSPPFPRTPEDYPGTRDDPDPEASRGSPASPLVDRPSRSGHALPEIDHLDDAPARRRSPDEDRSPVTALDSPGPEAPAPVSPALPIPLSPAAPIPVSPAVPTPVSPAVPTPVSPAVPTPVSPAVPIPVSPGVPIPVSPAVPMPVSPGVGPIATEEAGVTPEAITTQVIEEPAPAPQPAPRKGEAGEWRGIVLVTGTDTDVGKTIVTSAIAAAAQAAGLRVAVVKPGQTGTAEGGPTDIDLITRLAHPHTTRTLASYPEPLAPLAAARVSGLAPLELYEVVDAIRAESAQHDLVLVEGAGGLLVPMGVRPSGDSWTLADLATTLGVQTIVVARAGLGTLNHTYLTLEALERRGVPAKVVLGAWPAEPELVHWANLTELVPHLVGALPDGAGGMEPGVFQRSAPGWLTPALYGVLDNWRVWADEVS